MALLVLSLVGIPGLILLAMADRPPSRQEIVTDRGAKVMPFDLSLTTHLFDAKANGGVQTVLAKDPADREQVALVRDHLHDEARRFAAGNFDDPAAIHGDEMPGLAILRERANEIVITEEEVPGGARITYIAGDPELVSAIHDWFDAQVMDHGEHARDDAPEQGIL